MRLSNKVAIVTGAAAGIGEAIALRFAQEGCRLVLNDLDAAGVHAVAERIKKQGGSAEAAPGDISQEETGKQAAAKAISAFGALDIVVNNAADFTQVGLEEATLADWDKVLRVNVLGMALVSKFAIPHMKERGGSIVNIASMSGIIAQPKFVTYSASKAAQLMMTRSLACDMAEYRIRVNSIAPGCVETPATHREAKRLGITFEAWSANAAPMHLLNRLGRPEEVANAALFLASDEASFITGANLMVDGGYTVR